MWSNFLSFRRSLACVVYYTSINRDFFLRQNTKKKTIECVCWAHTRIPIVRGTQCRECAKTWSWIWIVLIGHIYRSISIYSRYIFLPHLVFAYVYLHLLYIGGNMTAHGIWHRCLCNDSIPLRFCSIPFESLLFISGYFAVYVCTALYANSYRQRINAIYSPIWPFRRFHCPTLTVRYSHRGKHAHGKRLPLARE